MKIRVINPNTTLSMTQNTDGAGDTSYSQSINAASITESVISNAVIVSYIGLPDSGPNGTTGTDTLIINASDVYTYTGGGYLTQDILPGLIELYSQAWLGKYQVWKAQNICDPDELPLLLFPHKTRQARREVLEKFH